MWPNNSVLGGIDEFRQSRLGFDILNGIDTAKLYPYTGSKKVSGFFGSNTSLQVITVTRSSVSDKLMMLCVHPGIM